MSEIEPPGYPQNLWITLWMKWDQLWQLSVAHGEFLDCLNFNRPCIHNKNHIVAWVRPKKLVKSWGGGGVWQMNGGVKIGLCIKMLRAK